MLVDVAGLVPGASQGRGRGNAFLSDLAECDALIQVIDVAGTTDIEGNPTGIKATKEQAIEQALAEVEFLTGELDAWILGLVKDGWSRGRVEFKQRASKDSLCFCKSVFQDWVQPIRYANVRLTPSHNSIKT